MKSVHEGVDLEAGGVVYVRPDAAEVVGGARLEEGDVEAVAYAVGCGGYACDSGADDGNFWAGGEVGVGVGSGWREDFVEEALDYLEEEEYWVEEEVGEARWGESEAVFAAKCEGENVRCGTVLLW